LTVVEIFKKFALPGITLHLDYPNFIESIAKMMTYKNENLFQRLNQDQILNLINDTLFNQCDTWNDIKRFYSLDDTHKIKQIEERFMQKKQKLKQFYPVMKRQLSTQIKQN